LYKKISVNKKQNRTKQKKQPNQTQPKQKQKQIQTTKQNKNKVPTGCKSITNFPKRKKVSSSQFSDIQTRSSDKC
jgi:hypothetical protein